MKYFMLFLNKFKFFDVKLFVCVLAVTVVLSQFALKNSQFRGYLTGIDMLEGTVPVSSENIVTSCNFDLNIISGDPSADITVLINGEPYCVFDKKKINITIKQQSVIEILNKSNKSVTVRAENFSDNAIVTLNNGNVKVDRLSLVIRVVPK